MDIKLIKNLVSILENSSINKLEVEDENESGTLVVKLEKNQRDNTVLINEPIMQSAPVAAPAAAPSAAKMPENSEGVLDYNLVDEITSPMVGIYYASPSPDASPFVTKGKRVRKGETLCIIEAMKLMNEVVADRDGEIVEVCASNGSLVEFGQVLFKIF